jgi:hypothetical protein
MKTTMTLLLAARILVSFGMGTAMAQSDIPSAAIYFSGHRPVAPRIIHGWDSSDRNTRSGGMHFGYGTPANPCQGLIDGVKHFSALPDGA